MPPDDSLFVYNGGVEPRTIRLIQLQPGRRHEDICFELTERHFVETFDYYALSYVWGDVFDRKDVICCGRRLSVTSNLHAVLRRIRATHASDLLWVDAICINHDDIAEKTAQVRMMTEIYARAQFVLIWLGEEEPDDELGIQILHQFTEAVGIDNHFGYESIRASGS